MSERTQILFPILVILATLSFGAYSGYGAYTDGREAARLADEELSRVSENEEKIREALVRVSGVTSLMIRNGFWYTHRDSFGAESVLYFDLAFAARQDLTDEQLASLISHLQASEFANRNDIRTVTDTSLSQTLQFHNALYQSVLQGESTLSVESALTEKVRSGTPTSEELFQLSYLRELQGDYAGRDALNAQNCELYRERCEEDVRVRLEGKVVDKTGAAIAGASVELLSKPGSTPVETGVSGEYTLFLASQEMEKLRIHASKRNFSDGYADTIVLEGRSTERFYHIDDIQLESPIGIVTIDYDARVVTGIGNTFNQDGSVTLRTSQSTYTIPSQAIVHKDGTSYRGKRVDIYLYEFTKGESPPNLIALDTFDEVRGYAGNLMKSFGMPYIQFFAPEGEELHVLKSRPMELTYRIPDMDALYRNTDGIYRALTDRDMEQLVRASHGGGYPIDQAFLIGNDMLQFPAFWVFDRRRGVWDNVGIAVLNQQGTIGTIFYTIRG